MLKNLCIFPGVTGNKCLILHTLLTYWVRSSIMFWLVNFGTLPRHTRCSHLIRSDWEIQGLLSVHTPVLGRIYDAILHINTCAWWSLGIFLFDSKHSAETPN